MYITLSGFTFLYDVAIAAIQSQLAITVSTNLIPLVIMLMVEMYANMLVIVISSRRGLDSLAPS